VHIVYTTVGVIDEFHKQNGLKLVFEEIGVYGVRCMVYGVWCMVCMVYGVWCAWCVVGMIYGV